MKLTDQFCFDSSSVTFISSYLENWKQKVDINGVLSSYAPLKRGVPQRSVLGPLLFCIFINDLPNIVRYAFTHLYADDAQLYKAFQYADAVDATNDANADLIAVWAARNRLELNANKS